MFDCDGLLVASATCWEKAYASIAAAHGRSPDDIGLEALVGASAAQAAAGLSRDLGVAVSHEAVLGALHASFAAEAPRVLPGVRELVGALSAVVPLAVASNGPRDIVVDVLERAGLLPFFAAVVSAEDAGQAKPDPAVYLEACRRCGVAPADAIAFEDSALGAQAARTAGLVVVLAPSAPGIAFPADLTVSGLDDARLLERLPVPSLPALAD